jgi:hypothetical protein
MTLGDHSLETDRDFSPVTSRFVFHRRRSSIFSIGVTSIGLAGVATRSFVIGDWSYGLLMLIMLAAILVYEALARRLPYVSIGDGEIVVRKAFIYQKSIDARFLIGVIEGSWSKLDIVYGDGSKVVVSLDALERQDQQRLISEVKRLARLAPSNNGIEQNAVS